jgi:pimeloyl-ACP methyl ester carboxylesterase
MHVIVDRISSKLCSLALLALLAAVPIAQAAQATKTKPPPRPAGALAVAAQGYFFVGGQYATAKDGQQIMVGQMYVQYQVPQQRKHRYPIVMWHGGGQTGTNFLGTPDGRMGWAEYFVREGYTVYVVDQPARARSGFFPEAYGATRRPNAQAMSERFTAPEIPNLYPQAKLHTQWPGKGVAGDPVFDQFFSSQVEDIANLTMLEDLNRNAGIALLDRIGAAILLTHSQSGPFGWELADARPALVKGVVAVEPNGPPFYENSVTGPPGWFKDAALGRAWGITRLPLQYDPPAAEPKDLGMTQQAAADGPNLVRCWLQDAPARQLVNLKGVPILIVASEASYHAPYDHCTSKYLAQAGVKNTFVRLPDAGIHGNGHMMMLEKNNLQIAALLKSWVDKNVR